MVHGPTLAIGGGAGLGAWTCAAATSTLVAQAYLESPTPATAAPTSRCKAVAALKGNDRGQRDQWCRSATCCGDWTLRAPRSQGMLKTACRRARAGQPASPVYRRPALGRERCAGARQPRDQHWSLDAATSHLASAGRRSLPLQAVRAELQRDGRRRGTRPLPALPAERRQDIGVLDLDVLQTASTTQAKDPVSGLPVLNRLLPVSLYSTSRIAVVRERVRTSKAELPAASCHSGIPARSDPQTAPAKIPATPCCGRLAIRARTPRSGWRTP